MLFNFLVGFLVSFFPPPPLNPAVVAAGARRDTTPPRTPRRWFRPAVVRPREPPAPSRPDAAPLSRERLRPQLSREPCSYNLARAASSALFASGAGLWRSARTSASPRAARRAPRRKCKGGRERRRRGPGVQGGAPRRQDAADAGRMAAGGSGRLLLLSWRRLGAGRAAWRRERQRQPERRAGPGRGGHGPRPSCATCSLAMCAPCRRWASPVWEALGDCEGKARAAPRARLRAGEWAWG